MQDKMKLQSNEFDAVLRLRDQYRRIELTPVVDDDYPEVRYGYESAIKELIEAMIANGRIQQQTSSGMSDVLKSQGFNALRAANMLRQEEWDRDSKITLEYRGNELGGECGEALNEIKKLARERIGIRGSRTTVEKLADELADVVICVDLVCMMVGVDMFAAVRRKFNSTSEKNDLKTRL